MFIIVFVSITSYFRGSQAKIFALPCISLPLSLPGVPANPSSQGRRACFSFCTWQRPWSFLREQLLGTEFLLGKVGVVFLRQPYHMVGIFKLLHLNWLSDPLYYLQYSVTIMRMDSNKNHTGETYSDSSLEVITALSSVTLSLSLSFPSSLASNQCIRLVSMSIFQRLLLVLFKYVFCLSTFVFFLRNINFIYIESLLYIFHLLLFSLLLLNFLFVSVLLPLKIPHVFLARGSVISPLCWR